MPEEGKKRKSGVSKFIGIVKHFTRPVYIKIVLIVVCSINILYLYWHQFRGHGQEQNG